MKNATANNRKYRNRNSSLGLCYTCGQPPEPGKKRCGRCLDNNRAWTESRHDRLRKAGLCLKCGQRPARPEKIHCQECQDRHTAAQRRKKSEVFAAYGGAHCACCGETVFEFLTIDHINGGGTQHRKATNRQSIYQILRREGFPPGYQVLCWNCNAAKGIYGECPHQRTCRLELRPPSAD